MQSRYVSVYVPLHAVMICAHARLYMSHYVQSRYVLIPVSICPIICSQDMIWCHLYMCPVTCSLYTCWHRSLYVPLHTVSICVPLCAVSIYADTGLYICPTTCSQDMCWHSLYICPIMCSLYTCWHWSLYVSHYIQSLFVLTPVSICVLLHTVSIYVLTPVSVCVLLHAVSIHADTGHYMSHYIVSIYVLTLVSICVLLHAVNLHAFIWLLTGTHSVWCLWPVLGVDTEQELCQFLFLRCTQFRNCSSHTWTT